MLSLFPGESETIVGLSARLRRGETSCVAILDRCLQRIAEWEPKVRAWVIIDSDGAMEQAERLDAELAEGRCRGPLHGIPFGIKDIIDVQGLPTACGFAPWRERTADEDAPCVAALRHGGAVILGKTVTTQFAWIDPPVTRNPWNHDRTPGGSSSGSAAAVASGMCLAALGTQTGGSVTRPAAFCGVPSYKFRHRPHHMPGIFPFAPTLDHLGVFARSVTDLHLTSVWLERWYDVVSILGANPGPAQVESWMQPYLSIQNTRRLFVHPHGFFERRAEPTTLAAFDDTLRMFESAGIEFVDWDDANVDLEGVLGSHRRIMAAEAAAGHEERFQTQAADYAPHIHALVREGLSLPVTSYIRDLQELEHRREHRSHEFFPRGAHALLAPATIGPAPDPSTTGNPCMNSPWSYYGLPVISVPTGLSAEGMPLSIQVVGQPGSADLFGTAAWCESIIRRASGAGSD